MGLFDSLIGLGKDVVDIVKAPVEIAVDAARVVTKEVANMANEVVKDVKEEADGDDSKQD